ncbi:hypothetical protein [Phenylobacterium sp.]|uniref:hypothetical protein n=1 Tax=Phenylobacterium sp. TaxID=1871053 RepID=UPI003569F380
MGGAIADNVADLAGALPVLMPAASDLLARRRPGPIELYLDLADSGSRLDLASPAAADFQRKFNGFYGVRRNAAWRSVFYATFEAAKQRGPDPAALFRWALAAVERETGRVEASFVSKLVATLRPEAPVLDSVIREFLAARMPAPRFGAGSEEAVTYYDWLQEVMTALSQTTAARAWCDQFDAQFAAVAGASSIHPVKKLDFLIWAGGRP